MPLWTDKGFGWQEVQGARADAPSVAFLCCPGPSLAHVGQDLRGPGRTVYALNTAYPKIHPDAWIGLDRTACFDPRIWHEAFPKITRRFDDDNAKMRHQPNTFFADLEAAPAEEIFIRRDNKSKFVWVENSFVFALHFLIWSGHKRIHFIGCDMGGGRDYYDRRVLTPEQRASNRRLYDDLVSTVRRLQPLALRNGIEFVSSTPDSPLNAFLPTQSIEEAITHAGRGVPAPRPVLHVRDTERHIDRQVVLVLKSGGEYKIEHAERLIKQLPDCSITLLTDFGIDNVWSSKFRVKALKHDWPNWWSKMELFSPELGFLDRPFLYLDLDTTVFELPDTLWTPKNSVGIHIFTEDERKNYPPYHIQSGVMLLHPRERAVIWNEWRKDPENWMRKFRGDQDFISSCADVIFDQWYGHFPGDVVSYKMNWLPNREWTGKPLDRSKVKIVAFHGKPRPWEIEEIQRPACRQ